MNRSSNDNCLLCQGEEATQTNSHIVPKFMCKGILGNQGPRKAFIINIDIPEKKPTVCQDSPKENYILCPSCEDYFQVLETYISEHLHKRVLNEKYKDDFYYLKNSADISFAECLNTNSLVANLFFYPFIGDVVLLLNSLLENFILQKKNN